MVISWPSPFFLRIQISDQLLLPEIVCSQLNTMAFTSRFVLRVLVFGGGDPLTYGFIDARFYLFNR